MLGTAVYLLLAASAQAAVLQDKAGNRIERLSISTTEEMDGTTGVRACVSGRTLCINIIDEEPTVLRIASSDDPYRQYDFATDLEGEQDGQFSFWPDVVRLSDGALVGIERENSTAYSGGGGQASELILISVRTGMEPQIVLKVPLSASIMIRACFSEEDFKQRSGACHDEYGFGGTIELDPVIKQGMPVFRYKTLATSFPGHVSRSEDSLAAKPLRKKDIRKVTDLLCSYGRVFRFDTASGRYKPDTPLPDCADYTVP